MTDNFGARVTVARDLRECSITQLAEKISVTRQYIDLVERGDRQPSDEVTAAMSAALRVPQPFFERRLVAAPSGVHFRKRASTTKTVQRHYVAHLTLLAELIDYVERHVLLPVVRVPQRTAHFPRDVETAASDVREMFGIVPNSPVGSVTRAIEHAGVVVVDVPGVPGDVDAFSSRSGRPVIVRNSALPSASRARFSTPHECGHLVMHTHTAASKDTERQADAFASAFLLPAEAFAREFPRTERWDWSRLFDLKVRWGASLAAIIHRAHGLGLIDAARYRTANMYLRTRNWHRGEPEEPEREPAEALSAALSAIIAAGERTPEQILTDLGWTPELFEEIAGFDLGAPASVVSLGDLRRATA